MIISINRRADVRNKKKHKDKNQQNGTESSLFFVRTNSREEIDFDICYTKYDNVFTNKLFQFSYLYCEIVISHKWIISTPSNEKFIEKFHY